MLENIFTEIRDRLNLTKEKLKVLGLHIVLSIVIFVTLLVFIKIFWFPGNLIEIDGGWTVIKLIAGVDIVLGPLLTFLFIHPERESFKKDFAMIVGVQLIALFAGIFTVIDQRVDVIVFSDTKFYSISHGTLVDATEQLQKIDKKPSVYKSDEHSVLDVAIVASVSRSQNIEDVFNNHPELPVRPDAFESLKNHWALIEPFKVTDEQSLARIRSHSLMDGNKLFGMDVDIYPLKGRYKNGFILFDSKSKKIIDIVVE